MEYKFKSKLEAKLKNKNKTTTAAGGTTPSSMIYINCAKMDPLNKIQSINEKIRK